MVSNNYNSYKDKYDKDEPITIIKHNINIDSIYNLKKISNCTHEQEIKIDKEKLTYETEFTDKTNELTEQHQMNIKLAN